MTVATPSTLSPFTEHHDLGFYVTPELTQRLALIQHLLQNSEQLLLVMAARGHGKTSLLKQVAANQAEHWKVLTVSATPEVNEERLLSQLLKAFNVRTQGKTLSTMQENLRSYVAATRYNGQLPVLLVDDAHMLPLDALKFLIQLVMSGEAQTRMRVLLFCEPQISSVFAAPEFAMMRNALIHTLDIPAFNEAQVRAYLQFRLNQADYQGSAPFSSMTIKALHQNSEGVPGKLNKLAQEILQEHMRLDGGQHAPLATNSGNTSKSQHSLVLWGIGAALLCLAATAWWLIPSQTDESLGQPRPLALPEHVQTPEGTDAETPAALVEVVEPQEEQEFASDTTDGPLTEDQEAAEEAAANAEMRAAEEQDLSASQAETSASTVSAPSLLTNEEIEDLPGVKSAYWLSQQNPDDTTIQVLGTYSKDTVKRFIARHRLQGTLALFLTTYKDRPWYVLTYGLYAEREEATRALHDLPASLQRNSQPWVRSLRSIHQNIQNTPQ